MAPTLSYTSGKDIACRILSNSFSALPISTQCSEILSLYQLCIAQGFPFNYLFREAVHAVSADIFAHNETNLSDACRLTEAIWGLNFSTAQSLYDMRGYQRFGVEQFYNFLQRQPLSPAFQRRRPIANRKLKIGYLCHHADYNPGNSSGLMIQNVVAAHSLDPESEIYFYCVQWREHKYLDDIKKLGVKAKSLTQELYFNRLDILLDSIRSDELDVIISDLPSPIATWLFKNRVASMQMYLDPGMPHWDFPELDWVLLCNKEYSSGFCIPQKKTISIIIPATTQQDHPQNFVIKTRNYASKPIRFGCISRLIKISNEWIACAQIILRQNQGTKLFIAGPGDAALVTEKLAQEFGDRFTLINEMIDISSHLDKFDVLLDTFPFIGGFSCMEIMSQGIPVVSFLAGEWDYLIRSTRDPNITTNSIDEYIGLSHKLNHDPAFFNQASIDSKLLHDKLTNPEFIANEISSALDHAIYEINHVKHSQRS
ncbi:MAG: hypothetical protein RIR18_800 [Pseudomonadota bacterium]|jgi:predicted O-linked N-acetylglucosamine transferase (SPINDLY family)